jgi:hypothetical protein
MWGLRTEAVRGGGENPDPRRLAADIPRTAVPCNCDRLCPVVHRALNHHGAAVEGISRCVVLKHQRHRNRE